MNIPLNMPRRLIEVDLPIKEISAHARREKSIRHGHISTLHIWWARRPLAACRAVLCAALWPDPADPACPPRFRETAAQVMTRFARAVRQSSKLAGLCANHWSRWNRLGQDGFSGQEPESWKDLRGALLDFIADFANSDASTVPEFLDAARILTQAAHEALGGAPGTRPLVVDPFAGGGAIPLEALRIGADAFASDLNPVAVLLNKVVLEYIPKHGKRLAEEVRRWGAWIKERAEEELGRFYPKDPDGAVPIAYLWARTIRCEGPGCGAEVPLMRSLWLSKKKGRQVGLRLIPRGDGSGVDAEIVEVPTVSQGNRRGGVYPHPEGTVRRGSATCPCCGYTTPVASVRSQLKARRGGAADARLMAVVTTRPGQPGRFYRLPTDEDFRAAQSAAEELRRREAAHTGPLSLVPEEPTPNPGGHRAVSSVQLYGLITWGDLFTPRQVLALTTLVRLVREAGERCRAECDAGLAEAVTACLGLVIDKQADLGNSLCAWEPFAECPRHLFGRQAIPIVWDFAESVPVSESSGGWAPLLDGMIRCFQSVGCDWRIGHAQPASATAHPLPDDAAQAFVTDPPYYDAVPYADLSDFFYVWLRRTLNNVQPILLGEATTPKEDQAVVLHPGSAEERAEFERKMQKAMEEGRRVLAPAGVGLVVFAHKSTAGWESMLQAMVDAGWIITASWPVDTEMGTRINAMGTASLASSVHLVCRPRENPDGSVRQDAIGDWRQVLRELPQRIHAWLPRLASEGVVGADAVFSCLGPALEIFSRYSRVEKASGEVVTLREYLEQVWAAVAREALAMIFDDPDTAGLEEDARLTAMWLWTLSTGANGNGTAKALDDEDSEEEEEDSGTSRSAGFTLEFDAARKIAQGLGAHLEDLGRMVEIKKDKARLLSVGERTRHLFGKVEGPKPARRQPKGKQLNLFEQLQAAEKEADWGRLGTPPVGGTVLDRVHQAMILFGAGRTDALKRFLVEEGAGRDTRFWKLAQALSALYPAGTEEKRWVDGVLARKKGLGF